MFWKWNWISSWIESNKTCDRTSKLPPFKYFRLRKFNHWVSKFELQQQLSQPLQSSTPHSLLKNPIYKLSALISLNSFVFVTEVALCQKFFVSDAIGERQFQLISWNFRLSFLVRGKANINKSQLFVSIAICFERCSNIYLFPVFVSVEKQSRWKFFIDSRKNEAKQTLGKLLKFVYFWESWNSP